jgi:hypothetical protein
MTITLKELNAAVAHLPNPAIWVEMRTSQAEYRVQIAEPIRLAPVTADPPTSVNVRYVTFRAKEYRRNGSRIWKWSPVDEVVI